MSFVYPIDMAGKHRSVKTESSVWFEDNEVRWRNGAGPLCKMYILVQAWSLGLDLKVE